MVAGRSRRAVVDRFAKRPSRLLPAARRLAINLGGKVTVYDTLDHQIGGVSQQQSGDASFTFVSQRGLVRLADLPVVSARTGTPAPPSAVSTPRTRLFRRAPKEPTQVAGSAPAQPARTGRSNRPRRGRNRTTSSPRSSVWPIFMQRVFFPTRSSPPRRPSY